MAPDRWSARAARMLALITLATLVGAPAANALRIVDYNILNYPGSTGPTRDPSFRTILQPISPDVLVTEEMTSQAGVTEFLNSLNTMEPGQWAALPFIDGNDTDCALFYKPSKIGFASQWSFYPNPANLLRLVHVYRIRPVSYSSNAADIRLYALHLKGVHGLRIATAGGVHGPARQHQCRAARNALLRRRRLQLLHRA